MQILMGTVVLATAVILLDCADSRPPDFEECLRYLHAYDHHKTFKRGGRLYQTIQVDERGRTYVQLDADYQPIELIQDISTLGYPTIEVSEHASSWIDVACRLKLKAQSRTAQSPQAQPPRVQPPQVQPPQVRPPQVRPPVQQGQQWLKGPARNPLDRM